MFVFCVILTRTLIPRLKRACNCIGNECRDPLVSDNTGACAVTVSCFKRKSKCIKKSNLSHFCAAFAVTSGSLTYIYSTEKYSYKEAEDYCSQRNATLAVLSSQLKQDILISQLLNAVSSIPDNVRWSHTMERGYWVGGQYSRKR